MTDANSDNHSFFSGNPALAGKRVVFISPHLDDAVMSVGASIAAAVRSGANVEVFTVFGYGPVSPAKAGPWDTRAGFRTESEACRVRRSEDAKACEILGATKRWLDFGAEPYERRGTPEEILSTVIVALAGADYVFLPGFPLTHPDHAELSQLLLSGKLPGKIGLYVEQPYLFWERKKMQPAMRARALESIVKGPLDWIRQPVDKVERSLKSNAVRAYGSQLRLLGLSRIGLMRMIRHEKKLGGEPIAWLA